MVSQRIIFQRGGGYSIFLNASNVFFSWYFQISLLSPVLLRKVFIVGHIIVPFKLFRPISNRRCELLFYVFWSLTILVISVYNDFTQIFSIPAYLCNPAFKSYTSMAIEKQTYFSKGAFKCSKRLVFKKNNAFINVKDWGAVCRLFN